MMNLLSPHQSTLQHINSITHEGKVIVLATATDGKIWYTIKQDGFEDSYLNTPPDQRTGWENWQQLELPNESKADESVVKQEQAELTYLTDSNRYILRSRYQTVNETAVAPVQVISALGHLYVFRQSKTNTLLVDRFVVDGMTNKLNRKLEVRFKRSKQKHTPTKSMKKGSNGLSNVDTLDFRDSDGNFFYEPTTEICAVNNLINGWFSVVLVPTFENDIYRWHIFAYNTNTKQVELTTLRASEEGLFAVKDYNVFEETNETLVPRQIAGIIKRNLDITGATVTNSLTATTYDLQQEQQTQSGEMQLLKTATRIMLAIPTDKGTAAFSFAIAGDGTLSEIDETPDKTLIRSKQREVLLPLNTLDEIKALADRTPPPQGIITGLAEGTDEEDAENLVKITTDGKAGDLANGDLVKILGTSDYKGLYQAKTVDENTFDIDLGLTKGLGYWEKEDEEEGGLIFDGMITAYEKTADGKLRVTCPNHGLENGDEVQIAGTEDYNDSYPVKKLDDTHFIIERQWATGSAINIKLVSRKRRGIVFDGTDDHVFLPEMNHNYSQGLTIEAWVWYDGLKNWSRIIDFGNGAGVENIILANAGTTNNLSLHVYHGTTAQSITAQGVLETGKWMHLAASIDESGRATLYKNGEVIKIGSVHLPKTINRTQNYIARSNWSNDSYFQGKISDLRLWKTARTTEDIKNSMYLQLTGKELGLLGYWRLGAIGEGQVVDFSSNGQDGSVYGDAYVSAATLNRKLAGGLNAVKYSNSDLFAVSERTTYEESFEFKIVSSSAVNLAYLDNADGKNLGTKIFTLSYWGKASRSAEEKQAIAPEQIKQNKFEDLGGGWYRVSANVTIPDGIGMLRCFEIANVKGDWQSLEIRKHRIRLMSDSVTEFKYSDSVSLATLADNQASLTTKLKQLQLKEQQEGVLLKEKQELEAKIAAYNAQAATRAEIQKLESKIVALTSEEQTLQSAYQSAVNSPFNYFCQIKSLPPSRRGKDVFCHEVEVYFSMGSAALNSSMYNNYGILNYSLDYILSFRPEPDKWQFIHEGDGLYSIKSVHYTERLATSWFIRLPRMHVIGRVQSVNDPLIENPHLVRDPIQPPDKWQFIDQGGDFYFIKFASGNRSVSGNRDFYISSRSDSPTLRTTSLPKDMWQLIKCEPSNNNIDYAKQDWEAKTQELKLAKNELQRLQKILTATPADKAAWDARLAQVIALITALQTELNTLNTDFLNGVKTTQQTPQTMPQIAKDGKGLITKGANLGFVNSVTRLNTMETSEGNVQLSYFDNQGRMRQTNYDATADSKNATFEQWIPDAQRTCLNFNNSHSVVKLNQALYFPKDWSIEAWFVYPLPETAEWNTLIRGKDADHHIVVRNRKQLGIFLSNDLLGQKFYDSGFNMELLSEGWHHLTAVGKGDTTLFYIDGKAVGNTKAKALADAEENLKKAPNDATAKKKVEDIKKAILKTTSDVFAIGNNHSALDKPVDYSVMKFDGVNDSINIGNVSSLNLQDNFTIEAWVYPTTLSGPIVIYSLSDNIFSIEKERLFFQKGGGSFETIGRSATNNRLTVNKWNHVVVVKSGSMAGQTKLYLNGVAIDEQTAIPTLTNVGQVQLGSQPNLGRYFQGQMAEVRVWNKARTQAEIQATMGKRLSGKEANLVAYYPLNKIESGKVLDLVTNNYATVVEASIVNDQTLSITPFISSEQFGKVSEVRVWGVALTDEEIAVNSKTLLSGNEPGLLAYYPFNEATGEIIRDQSGQGNNGAVSGVIWWGCTAPIGNPGNTVMRFDGVNDCVEVPYAQSLNPSDQFTVTCWVKVHGGQGRHRSPLTSRAENPLSGYLFYATPENKWEFIIGNGRSWSSVVGPNVVFHAWTHIAGTYDGKTLKLYVDGVLSGTLNCTYASNKSRPLRIGAGRTEGSPDFLFPGQIAEVCIWNKARTQAEIQGDMYQRLTGKEANLVAYYPLDKIQTGGSVQKVLDLAGNNHGTVTEAIVVEENSLPIVPNALLCNEYSSVSWESNTNRKVAMMRRFFAHPALNGVTLLPDKRVEALELKWVGNAQFAPTLLGYIEGPPPVPSENLTIEDDYNGATSVELTMSEDVEFNWTRSQDSGLGMATEIFTGVQQELSAGGELFGVSWSAIVGSMRAGFKGNFEFSNQVQNESSITSISSLSMTDKLELRGTPEVTPKFPHLGIRFIPKNIGYALVVSATADVFVTRLARSGKMIGYQVQPVDGIPPDVNTITFLMNPAYTMSGSLDGLTGSSATSDRFFKYVPEMRSQYGSLYPASYYRLKEAYNLKQQIEAEDKRRESYFSNFNVRLVDETSLNRNIDSGDAPTNIGLQREEDKPGTQMTDEEKKKVQDDKVKKFQDITAESADKTSAVTKQKRAEIQSKIDDQEKRVQATDSFAGWQKRMENLQIRSAKRNIVNTYVWDADGGLRTESQSFANTVEHTIGGSFSLNAGLGFEGQFGAMFSVELTAQATINLTQTMSKTELRSKGFELTVDLSGLEYRGITDYKDRPILPAEKVDRYRFMSFYLEGSTNHFQDFFNYVVDPEWLASNDEEARALRQTQAGKPNKTWRVLHRVTYVERPALMGFGRDVRQLRAADELSDQQNLLAKIAKLEENNRQLEAKMDQILNALKK